MVAFGRADFVGEPSLPPRRASGSVPGAIAEARRRGAGRLTILADPNAAAFYERAGAVRIGEAPSHAVPGRLLPLYEVRPRVIVISSLIWAADPSAKRPSAVRASFGEPGSPPDR